MALEYTLTETISPDEYKNSFVNFYRQVLGMGGTYGEDKPEQVQDEFVPQQTVMSYRDDDEKQPTNFDALDIKVLDAGSIAALPSLDFDKMKEDRLKLFEVPEGASIMERIEKRGPEVASKAVGTLPSFIGGASVGSALTGGALSALVGGSTGKSAFNKPMYRPSGFLGVLGDQMAKSQEKKLQAIAAHQAAGVSGDSGFAVTIGNLGIVRGPGESTYTGNRQGLSHKQIKNIEALSKGILPETYRFDRDDDGGDAIFTGGKKINQSIKQDGGVLIDPNDPTKGFYRGDGAIYSLKFGYSPVGMMSDIRNLAKNYGITEDQALSAITDARKGNGTVASNLVKVAPPPRSTVNVQPRELTEKETQNIAKQRAVTMAQTRERAKDAGLSSKESEKFAQRSVKYERGDMSEEDIADTEAFNQGGFVQRLAPGGGVAATASGFVDGVPPSQATDGQEVADDKDGKLPEGAYVINASAVTFAGEKDIVDMLRDAQKEAVRRGITVENPKSSSMIDVAVSRGEVVVSPHLVNIIGKDRLEKINNRGIKDTERKIEENGQQVQGAAKGELITVYRGEPLDPDALKYKTNYGYGEEDVGKFHTPNINKARIYSRGSPLDGTEVEKGNRVIKSRKVTVDELFDGVKEAWKTHAKAKSDYFAKMPKSELQKNLDYIDALRAEVKSDKVGRRSMDDLVFFLQEQVFHDDKSKINFMETFKNDPKSAFTLAGRAMTKIATKMTPPIAILEMALGAFAPTPVADATLQGDESFLTR